MIQKSYIVMSVEGFLNGVFLYLKPADVPQLKIEVIRRPQSDDARVAQEVAGAMVQQLKELMPPGTETPSFRPPSPFAFKVYLTIEEYEKLGKPTISDMLVLTMKKSAEE